jgi:hypothetical protein
MACADRRPTTGPWRRSVSRQEGGPGQDERATTPAVSSRSVRPLLLRPIMCGTAAPVMTRLQQPRRSRSSTRLGRRCVREVSVGMPSETYANIAPEAESGTLTANVLLWGSDGELIIGFCRILRPCSGPFLRVLRSPEALSASERTHGTDGSTPSRRLAGWRRAHRQIEFTGRVSVGLGPCPAEIPASIRSS